MGRELRREFERALTTGKSLALDMKGVSFLSREAIALLHILVTCKVTVCNRLPFVAQQLRVNDIAMLRDDSSKGKQYES